MTTQILTEIGVGVKGGTTQAFKTVADGFKLLGTELKKAAKDMLAMGNTQVADSLGHISMAVSKAEQSLVKLAKTGKDTTKQLTENSDAMGRYGKEITAVQQAWALFSKQGTASGAALKSAEAWTNRFSTSIQNLQQQMRIGGASEGSIKKWADSLNFADIKSGLKSGDLKMVGTEMQFVRKEGYNLMNMNSNLKKSIESFNSQQTIYVKEMSRGKGISTQYTDAVKQLGKSFAQNNESAKLWAPVLQKVNTALTATQISSKGLGTNFESLSKGMNLANITQGVLQKELKVTANGFQILNKQGLERFGGLTEHAAHKLGMLSKGFSNLKVKEGASSLTAFGKAEAESTNRTIRFQAELEGLSRKYGVVSQTFQDHYQDMKKSDDLYRKHITTLQKTGQINEATAKKSIEAFSASTTSAKQLAEAIALPAKQHEELRKAVNRTAVMTKASTQSLYAEAAALKAQKVPHDQIINAINAKIGTYKEYDSISKKIKTQEEALAKVSGANVKQIQARTAAQIATAKTDKDLVSIATKRLEVLKNETDRIKSLTGSQDTMAKKNIQLRSSYSDLVTSNRDFVKQLNETVKAYGRSDIEGRRAEAALKQQAKGYREAAKSMTIYQKIAKDVVDHIKSFASYAAAATFIASLVGGFKIATDTVIEFDQALKDLQAITGATDREVALMGETIKDVANKTKFNTTEVAEGMKILGQAGLSAQESIDTMQAVADLSTGTLSDMATSVDLVTTAMAVFNIKSTDASHIADVFANAVNKSKLDIEKLRVAFNYVGTIAEETGVTFEETAAAMAELSNKGIRASTIGTGLRQVLEALVKPSEEFETAVKMAGMSMDDFNPKLRSMGEIIGNLTVVVDSSEKAFKYFGIRGAAAVTALTANGRVGFERMKSAIEQSGTAAEMAAKQMEGLGIRLKNMYDKARLLALSMGELGLAAVLGAVIDGARLLLDALNALTNNVMGKFILQVGLTAAALAALYAAFMTIKAMSVGTIIASFITNFIGFTAAVKGAAVATGLLSFATNPLLLALAAVTAVVGAGAIGWHLYKKSLQETYNESQTLSNEFKSIGDSVSDYQQKVANMDKTSQAYKDSTFELRTKLLETAKGNTELAASARAVIASIDPLTGKIEEGSEALQNFYNKARQLENEELAKAFNAAGAVFENSMGKLSLFINDAKAAILGLVSYIKSMIPGPFMLSFVFELTGWGEVEEKLKRSSEEMLKFSDIIKRFKDGNATFEEMEKALADVGFASTALGKEMKTAFDQLKKVASDVIVKLETAGDIDYRMTAEEVLKIADDMKLLEGATDSQIATIKSLFEETKKLKEAEITGVAENWAAEFSKAGSSYEEFVGGMKEVNVAAAVAAGDLNRQEILELEKKKRAIADAAAANADMYKKGIIDVTSYERTKANLNKQATDLSIKLIESEDYVRFQAIRRAEKEYDEAMKVEQQRYDDRIIGEETFLRRREELGQKYADKLSRIKANIIDDKELSAQFKEFKEKEETLLASQILNIQKQEALKILTKAEAEKKILQITLESHKKIELEAKRHHDAINSQSIVDPVERAEAEKRYQDASTAFLKEQVNALKEVNDKRAELEENIKEWNDSRVEKQESTNAKIAEMEDDLADKILEIRKSTEEKIEELLEKRKEVHQKAEADILGNQTSLEDKIRKIRQKDMSDKRKEQDNETAAYKKYSRAIEELKKAGINKDVKLLEQAKKDLEDSGSLYEGLENTAKAESGVRKVAKTMEDLIRVQEKLDLAKIDKEIQETKDKSMAKIAIAKEESNERMAAENLRHKNEMDHLDKEIAKAKEKIAILNGTQDYIMSKDSNKNNSNETNKTDSTSATAQTTKELKQINGEWQEITKNVEAYKQEVTDAGTETAKVEQNIKEVNGQWIQAAASAESTGKGVTWTFGHDIAEDASTAQKSLEALAFTTDRVNKAVVNTTMEASTGAQLIREMSENVNALFSDQASPTEKLDAAMKAYNAVEASGKVATSTLAEMFSKIQQLAAEANKPVELNLTDNGRAFVSTVDEAGRKVTQLYDTLKASPLQFDKNSTVLKFIDSIPGMIDIAKQKISEGKPVTIPLIVDDTEAAYANLVGRMNALTEKIEAGQSIDLPLEIQGIEEELARFQEKIAASGDIFPVDTEKMFASVTETWSKTLEALKNDPAKVISEIDQASYKKVVAALKEITKDITVKIKVDVSKTGTSGKSQGGRVRGMASGGRLAGRSSTRDTELIKARKGEWFIRNEAAEYWDSIRPGLMEGINKPFSAMGRFLANTVQNQNVMTRNNISASSPNLTSRGSGDILSSLQSFGTMTINMGGESATIMADQINGKAFLRMIKKMEASAS